MREVHVACSPDADDLFMVRAILLDLIDTGPYRFVVRTEPTDALNRLGETDDVEVLAISTAWYPRLAHRWRMLPHGGSMGEGYGPVLVAREPMTLDDLRGRKVAVPGLTTTAWAITRMMVEVEPVVVPITPPERVFETLRSGEVEAAVLIHEGRLTFAREGFVQVAELGAWWSRATGGLPLPLGANTIRRDLPPADLAAISGVLRAAIAHALEDRDAAIAWLLARGGPLRTADEVSRYLDMYANQRTLDYGPDGRAAVEGLLARGAAAGLWQPVEVDWAP
ncbi:MAG: ABC transporter substrate-binding protein [Alphaproteobacteria bacterium]|nr:ABC transporter substrate-binding protein [Alphaproteobacteria bacterium]